MRAVHDLAFGRLASQPGAWTIHALRSWSCHGRCSEWKAEENSLRQIKGRGGDMENAAEEA